MFSYENGKFETINELAERSNRINCIEMGLKNNRIIYGCTNGLLKTGSINEFVFSEVNVKDRIIRCCLSPCEK